MRRSIVIGLASFLWLSAALVPSLASDDNSLQNMKGSVSYQKATGAAMPIALNASMSLADNDFAITGADSLAEVTLPDSSTVEVGAVSKIKMLSFKQATVATAKFIVVNGTLRFAVRHPAGAHANYTFQTPTGTIAVRGTQGDIGYDANGNLQVNVYEVCDVNLPVQVFANNGQTYTVTAGHSFIAKFVNGVLQVAVDQLTQQMVDRFNQFGIPTSWDQATGQVTSYIDNKTTGAVNGVTGGFGGQFVPTVGGLFKRKATPAPTAAPTSSSCAN